MGIDQKFYDASYFETGTSDKKSCYENYRWIPELTIPMAESIVNYLKITKDQKILDYGCAKGYLVKALRFLKYEAFGVDISEYALDKIDDNIKKFCKKIDDLNPNTFLDIDFDWVIAKDVFEHMSVAQIENMLKSYKNNCRNMFLVIPLGDDGKYRINEYHEDQSHVQMNDEEWWKSLFERSNWKIKSFEYTVKGVKDKWVDSHEKGNGFFTLENYG